MDDQPAIHEAPCEPAVPEIHLDDVRATPTDVTGIHLNDVTGTPLDYEIQPNLHDVKYRLSDDVTQIQVDDVTQDVGGALPTRFAKYRQRSRVSTDVTDCDTEDAGFDDVSKDINSALQWLRDEVMALKRQDKTLMRQLLDLRAAIHHLQPCHVTRPRTASCSSAHAPGSRGHVSSSPGSRGHVSSSSGSTVSADSGDVTMTTECDVSSGLLLEGEYRSLLRASECALQFRGRTVSMVTSSASHRNSYWAQDVDL